MRHCWYLVICVLFLMTLSLSSLKADQPFELKGASLMGKGSFSVVLPPGVPGVPKKVYQTSKIVRIIPSNKWWSSLGWEPYSSAHYPHPLAVKALPSGFQICYPKIIANETGIYGRLPEASLEDMVLGHTAADQFIDSRVDSFSDWFVTAKFGNGSNNFKVSYGHGSPYIYALYAGGDPKLSFSEKPVVWAGSLNEPVLGISVKGKHYGLFGPSGSSWSWSGSKILVNHLSGKTYFAIACLPSKSKKVLAKFRQHAYAHVKETQVNWNYNSQSGDIRTTFTYKIVPYEGTESKTIFALYPHQWRHTDHFMLPFTYHSVRGMMKTATGNHFETVMHFPGVLPSLPDVGSYDRTKLAHYVEEVTREVYTGKTDTYWIGKYLGKLAALVPIAEQIKDLNAASQFRNKIKSVLENWFMATEPEGQSKIDQLFYYDRDLGTAIGYPANYGSDLQLNDHHFHYGYFIRAAAEVARSDRNWAKQENWGAMVNFLIRDIANSNRQDEMFPFLRNFDSYAGHSWASGLAKYADGNNQESSSEAMNAWTGMILWGEATGDHSIRDLGIYLYTTEMCAIHEYWFDSQGKNHPSRYTPSVVTMVWGGKGVHTTWWTSNPEEVHGINWLPFHGGSLYLGRYPEYIVKDYQSLIKENCGIEWDKWEDLILMWLALAKPQEALRQFEAGSGRLSLEDGNSKANTYHWIGNFDVLGYVNKNITADYPIYAVFDRAGLRTYVVYNMSDQPLTVIFSDGMQIMAEAGKFTVIRKG